MPRSAAEFPSQFGIRDVVQTALPLELETTQLNPIWDSHGNSRSIEKRPVSASRTRSPAFVVLPRKFRVSLHRRYGSS